MTRGEKAQSNQARDAKEHDMRLYIARMRKERDTMESERNTWSDMFNRSIQTMKGLEDELQLEKRKKDDELSKAQVRVAQLEADVAQQKEKFLLDQDELQELRAKLYEIEKDKVHSWHCISFLATTLSPGLKFHNAKLLRSILCISGHNKFIIKPTLSTILHSLICFQFFTLLGTKDFISLGARVVTQLHDDVFIFVFRSMRNN